MVRSPLRDGFRNSYRPSSCGRHSTRETIGSSSPSSPAREIPRPRKRQLEYARVPVGVEQLCSTSGDLVDFGHWGWLGVTGSGKPEAFA
jgi:hypothetical protein